MFFRWFLVVCIVVGFASLALAQPDSSQKSLGTYGAWQTFTYNEGKQPVCYMVKAAHFPVSKKKKFARGPAYLMITHRPGENSKDVFNYVSGYNFKTGSDVTIHIGKSSFNLFTQKDSAWSRDAATDRALALAIRGNPNLKAIGTPAQKGMGTNTDTLDLKGAAAAYQAIGKACGLEVEPVAKTPAKPASATKKKPK